MHKFTALAGLAASLLVIIFLSGIVWLIGANNESTPGGYVGYVTQGAVFGHREYIGAQVGPTSTGKMWMANVVNVSVTPYTYDEIFNIADNTAVLSKDGMQIGFSVHTTFRINPDKVKDFVEHYSTMQTGDASDLIVKTAYTNFLSARIKTYARDAVQQFAWQELPTNIDVMGKEVNERVLKLTENTPFDVQSVTVGTIQYPASVAQSVAENQAQIQVNQKKLKEVEQAKLDAQKKVEEAKGIAEAMDLIEKKLSPQYLQYQAIQAQAAQVNSPNHTVIYIPVGPMGVPLTGTFDTAAGNKTTTEPRSISEVK